MTEALYGIIPPMTTPFDGAGELDDRAVPGAGSLADRGGRARARRRRFVPARARHSIRTSSVAWSPRSPTRPPAASR